MKIGIMGLGVTGYAVADYALSSGDNVFVSESAQFESDIKIRYQRLREKYGGKISAEFNGHTSRLVRNSGIIVKSPGISPSEKILFEAKKMGVPVVGELDFIFGRLKARPRNVIAITGTNGKTTTTALIGHILKNSRSFAGNKEVIVCGNIGLPLASVAKKITHRTTLVIEVSSYQLEDATGFYPDTGIILNITPDHLEHHGTMPSYIKAKSRIFSLVKKNAADCRPRFCVLNYDDSNCRTLSGDVLSSGGVEPVFFTTKKIPSDWGNNFKWLRYDIASDKYVMSGFSDGKTASHSSSSVRIKPLIHGMHNIENILASIAAVRLVDDKILMTDIKKSIESFRGVEHRLEFVRRIKGVSYVNDSKATNVDSTRVALESYPPDDKKIWLIMGGQGKGSPYSPLKTLISERVKGILLIGEDTEKIYSELSGAAPLMIKSGDLRSAVNEAFSRAVRGDVVLLSPACASFDQFKNFEHRGKEFKKIVNSLSRRKSKV